MTTNQPKSDNYDRPMRIALVIGLVAAVIAVAGRFISGPGVFFQSYLFAYLFWINISLGCLILLLLHFLVGSRWGLAIRRITEAGAGSIWLMAILFIPLAIGIPFLYPWARPAEVAANEVLQYKSFYLNIPFFLIRAVVFFAIWILLGFYTNRLAARLSTHSSDENILRGRLQSIGAFGLILITLTVTFASIDWLMSLEPFWSSTVFGLIMVIGQVLTAMSFALVMLNLFPGLSQGRDWTSSSTPIPYRDLGALMMTFVMGWAYLAYFQLLIIWAGNLPHEVVWYTARMEGGWSIIGIAVAIFQFVLPFVILLSTRARHNLRILAGLGVMLLAVNLLYLFWSVKPAFYPGQFAVSWLDIVLPLAIGGLWLAAFLYALKRRPALSRLDEVTLELTSEQEKAVH